MLVEYGGLEKKWPARFLKRQRQVLTEQAEKMEVVRYEVNVEDFEKWFAELKEPVKKYDIQPENMGFNIGGYMCAVTILRTARMGERQTAVECICANGSSAPSFIILTGDTDIYSAISNITI